MKNYKIKVDNFPDEKFHTQNGGNATLGPFIQLDNGTTEHLIVITSLDSPTKYIKLKIKLGNKDQFGSYCISERSKTDGMNYDLNITPDDIDIPNYALKWKPDGSGATLGAFTPNPIPYTDKDYGNLGPISSYKISPNVMWRYCSGLSYKNTNKNITDLNGVGIRSLGSLNVVSASIASSETIFGGVPCKLFSSVVSGGISPYKFSLNPEFTNSTLLSQFVTSGTTISRYVPSTTKKVYIKDSSNPERIQVITVNYNQSSVIIGDNCIGCTPNTTQTTSLFNQGGTLFKCLTVNNAALGAQQTNSDGNFKVGTWNISNGVPPYTMAYNSNFINGWNHSAATSAYIYSGTTKVYIKDSSSPSKIRSISINYNNGSAIIDACDDTIFVQTLPPETVPDTNPNTNPVACLNVSNLNLAGVTYHANNLIERIGTWTLSGGTGPYTMAYNNNYTGSWSNGNGTSAYFYNNGNNTVYIKDSSSPNKTAKISMTFNSNGSASISNLACSPVTTTSNPNCNTNIVMAGPVGSCDANGYVVFGWTINGLWGSNDCEWRWENSYTWTSGSNTWQLSGTSRRTYVRLKNDINKIGYIDANVTGCGQGTLSPCSIGNVRLSAANEIKNDTEFNENEKEFDENEILISPNPASDEITINSKNIIKVVSTYSIVGKLINSTKYSQSSKTEKLNISKLIAGQYILNIETDKSTTNKKFVKF